MSGSFILMLSPWMSLAEDRTSRLRTIVSGRTDHRPSFTSRASRSRPRTGSSLACTRTKYEVRPRRLAPTGRGCELWRRFQPQLDATTTLD